MIKGQQSRKINPPNAVQTLVLLLVADNIERLLRLANQRKHIVDGRLRVSSINKLEAETERRLRKGQQQDD